jgi:hypothetical protein
MVRIKSNLRREATGIGYGKGVLEAADLRQQAFLGNILWIFCPCFAILCLHPTIQPSAGVPPTSYGSSSVLFCDEAGKSRGVRPVSANFAFYDERQSEVPILSFYCPRCENCLTLHQPDPGRPDRLLATCDECKSWYLTCPKGNFMIPLPEFPDSLPLE